MLSIFVNGILIRCRPCRTLQLCCTLRSYELPRLYNNKWCSKDGNGTWEPEGLRREKERKFSVSGTSFPEDENNANNKVFLQEVAEYEWGSV
jgi:hypothetical protein